MKKLTQYQLSVLQLEFKRNGPIAVVDARQELESYGYSVPPGHYFDEQLQMSGCIIADGPKGRTVTSVPKTVL